MTLRSISCCAFAPVAQSNSAPVRQSHPIGLRCFMEISVWDDCMMPDSMSLEWHGDPDERLVEIEPSVADLVIRSRESLR
jgi:hypothetical protein